MTRERQTGGQKIEVENINVPGATSRVDAALYLAMRDALLMVLPESAPGLSQEEMRAAVTPLLPQDLYPAGEKVGWWSKTVQLDLEAKGVVVREAVRPLRWHRTAARPPQAAYDFASFPTLTTPRLVLRQPVPADAADIYLFRSDYETQQYNMPPVKNMAEVLAQLAEDQANFAARAALVWGVTLRGEDRVIGLMGFYFWDHTLHSAEWGYDLSKAYWRQGIAAEAGRALLKFAFEALRLHRVSVNTRMDNAASVGLMRALGFQHEGTRRESGLNPDGSYYSAGLFGMLADEYARQRR